MIGPDLGGCAARLRLVQDTGSLLRVLFWRYLPIGEQLIDSRESLLHGLLWLGHTFDLSITMSRRVRTAIVSWIQPSRPNAPRKITIAVMMPSTRSATRSVPHPLRRCWANTCVGGCCGG